MTRDHTPHLWICQHKKGTVATISLDSLRTRYAGCLTIMPIFFRRRGASCALAPERHHHHRQSSNSIGLATIFFFQLSIGDANLFLSSSTATAAIPCLK
ncbi:hypothetical protein K439DRAFT_47900 [Ramaria rubella]|nr:hypothetical protein K439DRAFT_47900 [Ramaria rubella]